MPPNHRIVAPLSPPGEPATGLRTRFDLGADWTCECAVANEDGEPVVGELRVYPRKGKTLPRGGLTTRLLRQVKLGEHLAAVKTWQERAMSRGSPREARTSVIPAGPGRGRQTRVTQSAADIDRDLAESFGLDNPSKRRRPGRPGRPDIFYAQLARDYVRAVDAKSRRPTADVAAQHNYSSAHTRDAIHEARARGFLTGAPKGRAGGDLTEKAHALLEAGDPREGSPPSESSRLRKPWWEQRAASTYADPRKRRALMRESEE